MPSTPQMVKGQKSAKFTVTDKNAPRRATDKDIAAVAAQLWQTVIERTPVDTGKLAGGWQMEKIADGVYHVYNDVYYVKFVEFGTKDTQAVPAMGKSLASLRARYARRRRAA